MTAEDRIVVVEYPKSGGTWVVSMLGHILGLPSRDIYVSEGFNFFDIKKHPWYENARSLDLIDSCVIKSHELPGSTRHDFQCEFVHLIRDGRDVVVSRYFYEKEFCVKNGLMREFKTTFEDYVERISWEWNNFVSSWLSEDVLTCRYEDLLDDPALVLSDIVTGMGREADPARIKEAVELYKKENLKKALSKAFVHNTFVRKGIMGDWKNCFNDRVKEIFKKNAGDVLVKLGYEHQNTW